MNRKLKILASRAYPLDVVVEVEEEVERLAGRRRAVEVDRRFEVEVDMDAEAVAEDETDV